MSTVLHCDRAAPRRSGQPPDRAGLPRVVGLDVARALAVFEMLGAHLGVVAPDVAASPSTWAGVIGGRAVARPAGFFPTGGAWGPRGPDMDLILGVSPVFFLRALPFRGGSPRR